ncbi:MAG TPA: hypothetical protein VF306_02285 [Pirellulales bacterium]
MRAAEVIVCERTSAWAVAFRRTWQTPGAGPSPPPLRLIETRSADECREELAARPDAFVIVELTPERCDAALDLILHVTQRCPLARSGVVADRQLAAYAELAREVGALGFVTSPRRLAGLCALAIRHAALRRPSGLSLREQIWADLPWA